MSDWNDIAAWKARGERSWTDYARHLERELEIKDRQLKQVQHELRALDLRHRAEMNKSWWKRLLGIPERSE